MCRILHYNMHRTHMRILKIGEQTPMSEPPLKRGPPPASSPHALRPLITSTPATPPQKFLLSWFLWPVPPAFLYSLSYYFPLSQLTLLFVLAGSLWLSLGFLVASSRDYALLQCVGFSLQWLLLFQKTGSRAHGLSSCSSVFVAHGLSCHVACGIFLNQGLNPCRLHWQVDSLPQSHQGSPNSLF